jgi:hypothetical protein
LFDDLFNYIVAVVYFFFFLFIFPFNKSKIYIQAGRIGSGRFSQQLRAHEQGQRKREGEINVLLLP